MHVNFVRILKEGFVQYWVKRGGGGGGGACSACSLPMLIALTCCSSETLCNSFRIDELSHIHSLRSVDSDNSKF